MLMQNFGVTNKEHYGMLWYFLEWSIESGLSHFGSVSASLDLRRRVNRVHCRAARIIYNLPKDMASEDVLSSVAHLFFLL